VSKKKLSYHITLADQSSPLPCSACSCYAIWPGNLRNIRLHKSHANC